MRSKQRVAYWPSVFLAVMCGLTPTAHATPTFAAPVPVNFLDPVAAGAPGGPIAVAGDTLAVGRGTVYIYERIGGVWVQSARLSTTDIQAGTNASMGFGYSLAISPDGNSVFVGDPGAACAGDASLPCGEILVFQKPSTGWADTHAPVARLTPSLTASEELGLALGISSDGSTLAVFGDAAYVYVKPAAGWADKTQTAVLGSASGTGNGGLALSGISVDAGVIAINTGAQSVLVYAEPGAGWQDTTTATATLTDSGNFDTLLGDFGSALKVVGGNIILIGAPSLGLALVYQEPGSGGWVTATSPTAVLQQPVGATFFGDGINMVGTTAVVGSGDALYLYDEPVAGWSSEAPTSSILLPTEADYDANEGRHSIYVTGSELATTDNDQCSPDVPGCIAGFVLSGTAGGSAYDGLMIDSESTDDLTTLDVRTSSGFTGDLLNFNFDVQNILAPATGDATFTASATGGTVTAASITGGGSCTVSGGKVSCQVTVAADASATVQITVQTNGTSTVAGVTASLSGISPITWDSVGTTLTADLPLTVAPSVVAQVSFTGSPGQTISGTLPVTYPGSNALIFTVVQQPEGTLTVDTSNGAFSWVPPDASFTGTTQFTYHVSDGIHTSIDAVVTLEESGGGGKSGGGGTAGIPLLALLWGMLLLRRRLRGWTPTRI